MNNITVIIVKTEEEAKKLASKISPSPVIVGVNEADEAVSIIPNSVIVNIIKKHIREEGSCGLARELGELYK